MFLSSISVLNSLRYGRSHGRRRSPVREVGSTPAEKQEQRRQVAAHNAMNPKFAGMLIENHRDVFGGQTRNQRWVVLDPAEATLSIWDQLRREAPKKVFSMNKITEVDSNPSFRNIFLWFEGGGSVSFAAEKTEDFEDWMGAFAAYDGNHGVAQPEQCLAAQHEAAHRQRAVLPAKTSDMIDSGPVLLPRRSSKEGSGPKRGSSADRGSNFFTIYRQCYLSEPSPEPAPGFQGADKNKDDGSHKGQRCPRQQLNVRRESTDYNTGPMEMRAVMPSMGMGEPAQGLSLPICEYAAICQPEAA